METTTQYRNDAEEVMALRAEVRELEMMGEQISYGLAQAQARNTELGAENDGLRQRLGGRGGDGWPYAFGQTLLLFIIQQLFSAVWALSCGQPDQRSDNARVLCTIADSLAQIGMLLWCIGIARTRGFGGLAWRLLVHAAGWQAVVWTLIWFHPNATCPLAYRLALTLPSNWWVEINPLMPGYREVFVATLIMTITFDSLVEFKLSRKFFNVGRELLEEALNGK